jgi:hypothetical protein
VVLRPLIAASLPVIEAAQIRLIAHRLAGVLVADVLDEQQHQDVILVLAGVHAAAEFIAARPKGGIEFGFFKSHCYATRLYRRVIRLACSISLPNVARAFEGVGSWFLTTKEVRSRSV